MVKVMSQLKLPYDLTCEDECGNFAGGNMILKFQVCACRLGYNLKHCWSFFFFCCRSQNSDRSELRNILLAQAFVAIATPSGARKRNTAPGLNFPLLPQTYISDYGGIRKYYEI